MSGAIKLDRVTVSFALADGRNFAAVAPCTLSVPEHQFVSIVGPTGCGKSTLLNVSAGLLRPASGSVFTFGQPLCALNKNAGYLFQQDTLMPWKTIVDNVAIGLEISGTPRDKARRAALLWLERVGLGAFFDRYPQMLSGGQKKRASLAQLLIRNPKLLLMDEPFGPLDAQTRVIMGDLLLKLWSEDRKAVMFVTHDLDEAIALSDRVIIMSAGPGSRIIGDYEIPLDRPRDIAEIRHDPLFADIYRIIWHALRDEVLTTYNQSSRPSKPGAETAP